MIEPMHDSDFQSTLPPEPAPVRASKPFAFSQPSSGFAPLGLGAAPASVRRLSTAAWLREGLRAAFFRRPRTQGAEPAALQVLVIALGVLAVQVALSRLEVVGPALFQAQAWLSTLWLLPVFIGAAWWASQPRGAAPALSRQALASAPAALVVWLVAGVPSTALFELYAAASLRGWLSKPPLASWSAVWPQLLTWSSYVFFLGWALALVVWIAFRTARSRSAAVVFSGVMLLGYGLSAWQLTERAWQTDYSASLDAQRPRLRLSQAAFETQQSLLQIQIDALPVSTPGRINVYGVVFAPYADEDVFLRESTMVADVLASRFQAQGKVLHLLNHATTVGSKAWATPENLRRSIKQMAQRMNLDTDVLVVYLTSHGAKDFKLAASNYPLEVEPISPIELRAALDAAGVRNRVIAVSACYSGGWIEALASDSTLVMTAADATHTSYGCGSLSELTFFGRAMFDEQLRTSFSFTDAFAKAVPLIKQREIDAGKPDGFSNPQISLGVAVAPVLQALEQELKAPAAVYSKPPP